MSEFPHSDLNDAPHSTKSWTVGTLADAIIDVRGGFSVNCHDRPAESGEIGILKTGAVQDGRFHPEENKAALPDELSRIRTKVKSGTIVLCRKNSKEVVGASALVTRDFHFLYLSDLLWQITPAEKHCWPPTTFAV
jgi:type I restriction enzyme S subunit